MAEGLSGTKLLYEYGNGWRYESHFRDSTFSYEILSGPLAGRRAYQDVIYAQVAPDAQMVTWYEETGTVVTLVVNLDRGKVYGSVCFPRWVWDDPSLTVGDKRELLDELLRRRAEGPDAPRHLHFEIADIIRVTEAETVDVR